MSLTSANRDTTLLHPALRTRVASVMADIAAANLPLRIFEAWRSPQRQRHLYAQGRTRPGKIVTYAQAWESYHQYGLAVDIVGFVNNSWTWDLPASVWKKMHEIGKAHGLERLGFETPHLQLADLKISDLMDGNWPAGGDQSWYDNLSSAIDHWDGQPPAPPLPDAEPQRPPLSILAESHQLDWSATPRVDTSDWHSMFDGQNWQYDGTGVRLASAPGKTLRSGGAPITCQTILDLYASDIHKASIHYGVAPELIVMTIATETAFARKDGFTGPRTFRWEAHVPVNDVAPPTSGDYSAGPMQTLATTARDIVRHMKLAYDPFAVAPYYASQPTPPVQHPLYEGAANIDIGTAEIRSRWTKTGGDPILVAAAYNAGGLYQTNRNSWHLRSSNDHLDRAAQWFGDACFVLSALR